MDKQTIATKVLAGAMSALFDFWEKKGTALLSNQSQPTNVKRVTTVPNAELYQKRVYVSIEEIFKKLIWD